MMVKKVAILGAGNGGMTAAADLKEQGFEISLYELPQFEKNLQVMQEKGGLLLQEPNEVPFKEVFLPLD